MAKLLNDDGIKNKQWVTKEGNIQGGNHFTHHSVLSVLSQLAYVGKKEINKTNKGKDQNSLKPEECYSIVESS